MSAAPGSHRGRRMSLRLRLLLGILLPMLLLVAVDSRSVYRQALRAADTAYDRTLLASAKSIGEMLEVHAERGAPRMRATLSYAALEPFEADNRSRMFYRVGGFEGETVSGFDDLPRWHGKLPDRGPYAALVDFYDDHYRDMPVRVAVLLQPVAGPAGVGMATIQVAETLELRHALAGRILADTLWRQALLLAVIVLVVVVAVQLATAPIRELSARIDQRSESDLATIESPGAPRELMPLIDATNRAMQRLAQLIEQQKRFVRDASHQLRTPFAVLSAQLQSARRGDVEAAQALLEIQSTVGRATELANQMLALAKAGQLGDQGEAPPVAWDLVVREVALDLSPLIADRHADFSIETAPARVRAQPWALRELVRNLLHNALRHSPEGAPLAVVLSVEEHHAVLTISDNGPGLSQDQRERLFQPFSSGAGGESHGLGLAICRAIVDTLGGGIALENRVEGGRVSGLDARVRLALTTATNPSPAYFDAVSQRPGKPGGAAAGGRRGRPGHPAARRCCVSRRPPVHCNPRCASSASKSLSLCRAGSRSRCTASPRSRQ